jgi:peptidoglycan hydrolase CwlO-like protein
MKPNIVMIIGILIIATIILSTLLVVERRKTFNIQSEIRSYEDSILVYKKELQILKLKNDSLNISLNSSLEDLEEKKTQIKNLKKKLYAKANSVKHLSNGESVEYLTKFLSKRGKTGE